MEATSRKSRVLEAAVIDERRLVVGVLEEEKRRRWGGRREQEGERRGLVGNGSDGVVVGLWRERRRKGTNDVLAVDKKLIAMAGAVATTRKKRTGGLQWHTTSGVGTL